MTAAKYLQKLEEIGVIELRDVLPGENFFKSHHPCH